MMKAMSEDRGDLTRPATVSKTFWHSATRRGRAALAAPAVAIVLLLAVPRLHAAQIDIHAFDVGKYDVFGELVRGDAQIGKLGDARSPYRGFLAFHVPQFTGTLSQAELISYYYGNSPDSVERVRWSEVTNPVSVVRAGGLTLTNVYADLGDGAIFGENDFPTGFYSTNLFLTSNALTAITAARGGDFAMGGDMVSLGANAVEYLQLPPWSVTLRLIIAAPDRPVIHTPVTVDFEYTNYLIGTVGASGATPLDYYWFRNGSYVEHSYGFDASPVSANLGLGPANSTQSVFVVVSNAFGQATSAVVNFKVPPTWIRFSGTNYTLRVGESFQLYPSIISLGSPQYPIYPQWRKNGASLPGEVNSYFWRNNVTTGDTGDYSLVVTNPSGVVTSTIVRLDVRETLPVFWYQPQDVVTFAGADAQLGVYAVAGPLPTVRWYRNGTLVATTEAYSNLSLPSVQNSDAGNYVAVASNIVGMVTSRVAHVTVAADPPVFTLEPANRTVYYGSGAEFFVAASGTPPPTYRWYHDGVLIPTNQFSGLYIFSVTTASAGSYFCVASNASGMATSTVATLTVLSVPPVLSGPADVVVGEGEDAFFTVTVANFAPPLGFQWQIHGLNLTGPSVSFSSQLTIANARPEDADEYRVIVTNLFGATTSRVATLTVYASAPVFILQPTNQSVLEGSTISFHAATTAAPPPTYFLRRDGITLGSLSGLGNPSAAAFTLNNVGFSAGGDYTIVASNHAGLATSAVARVSVQRAGPLDNWTIRNPRPQGRDLHSVVWGQNAFVVVGDNGALVTSPDGTNWTTRNTHTAEIIQAVTHGIGRFVAVTRSGTGLTSTNGENWDSTLILSNGVFWDVTFGNGNFLAVGEISSPYTRVAFRSTNGIDWSSVTIPFVTNASAIAATFGAGRFLVLDYSGAAYSSTDLMSWTSKTGVLPYVPYKIGSAYINGRFVVVTDGGYLNSSADGLAWGLPFYNGVTSKSLMGVAYGAGRYVAVARKGRIITSGDLQSWSAVFSPTADRLEDVVFANNLFVTVGENGTILTSSDGLSWSNQTRGVNYDLDGLGVANGLAIAVGKSGTILTSSNGTTWNYILAPGVPAELHSVAYGNGKWVAVGESTNILTSTNGMNWEVQTPLQHTPTNDIPAFSYLKSVLYASNLWVAVGVAGQIVTSPDALTWTVRSSPVGYDLNEVTYGNGVFVIVGDRGDYPNSTVLTSSDGVTWADHTYYTGKNARGIAFANGTFVMADNDGLILYSTNPVPASITDSNNWSYSTTGIDYQDGQNLRGVTWSNAFWVAVGNNGLILTSTNLRPSPSPLDLTWRQRRSPTFENLHAVRFINNTFVAIGNAGVILQSAPLTSLLFADRIGGDLRLTFSSPYEGVFKLQHTENFVWEDLALITNAVGTAEHTVPLPADSGRKFYRVIAP